MTAPVLALALAAATPAGEPAAPATRVAVEVFTVGQVAGTATQLVYVRREGALEGGANPDGRARTLALEGVTEIALLHSTSWRWEEDGRIVLTYLAWTNVGLEGAGARPLPPLDPPAPTDPLHPRPPEIRALDPLAHGLRHLAFLLRTDHDGAVAAALGPGGAALLEALSPEVAGELPPS